jgi:arginase
MRSDEGKVPSEAGTKRPIAIVGAASGIGIRPYDSGGMRRLDLAPRALRQRGLVARLAARDRGDVTAPPYRDWTRDGTRIRNEDDVADYSRALGREIAAASAQSSPPRPFVLALGGDCSIVLGALLGLRSTGQSPLGLVYIDAHADFGTPEESLTGSAASMCLALATGRGETALARLAGDGPLVDPADVVLIGRRDHGAAWYGHAALAVSGVLDLPQATVRELGPRAVAQRALDRLIGLSPRPEVDARGVAGFWIHLDADVLDPSVMPAVDSPEPGGIDLEDLEDLLRPLVRRPEALGLELTIYDPTLDPRGVCAERLVALLERLLVGD